jgi:hypothetical protein
MYERPDTTSQEENTMSAPFSPSPLTRVRRVAQRASYDREAVFGIIDATFVCHIAFAVEGQPHCIPTAHWRIGDTLYVHGSNGSRLLKALGEGAPASVCVSQVDGLVLARSAFHHSMNYRSAMIYGRFRPVEAENDRWNALQAFMDKIATDRWAKVRPPNRQEMAATTLLALTIEQAVAKQRNGPPKDDEADMDWPVWAGVNPIETRFGEPVADPHHSL